MLEKIGSIDQVPAFIESVKKGEGLLQGFGHRVYKSYDPRAKIIKKPADEVFAISGKKQLPDIALKLEATAPSDEFFKTLRLTPHVAFHPGTIHQPLGFPTQM